MTSPTPSACDAPSGGWASTTGAALLTLLLVVVTPATVVLAVMAMLRPLLPPDVPLTSLGLMLAGPAVGVTLFSVGGYFRPSGRDLDER